MLDPVDKWKVEIWKCVQGFYSPATEREMSYPDFIPIVALVRHWTGSYAVNIIYRDQALYFVYTDALTTEQIVEPVMLRGDGYKQLLEEAETALARYFSKEK